MSEGLEYFYVECARLCMSGEFENKISEQWTWDLSNKSEFSDLMGAGLTPMAALEFKFGLNLRNSVTQ